LSGDIRYDSVGVNRSLSNHCDDSRLSLCTAPW